MLARLYFACYIFLRVEWVNAGCRLTDGFWSGSARYTCHGEAMRFLVLYTLIALALRAPAVLAAADPLLPQVSSSIDRDRPALGETFSASIRVILPGSETNACVIFPSNVESRGILSLQREAQTTRFLDGSNGQRRIESMVYVFKTEHAGSLSLEWPDVVVFDPVAGITNAVPVPASKIVIAEPNGIPVWAILLVAGGLGTAGFLAVSGVRKKLSERRSASCQ